MWGLPWPVEEPGYVSVSDVRQGSASQEVKLHQPWTWHKADGKHSGTRDCLQMSLSYITITLLSLSYITITPYITINYRTALSSQSRPCSHLSLQRGSSNVWHVLTSDQRIRPTKKKTNPAMNFPVWLLTVVLRTCGAWWSRACQYQFLGLSEDFDIVGSF